jgi:hypothetical protein
MMKIAKPLRLGCLACLSGLWLHTATAATITITPPLTTDILSNPGIGIEEFHDGWGQTLTLAQHPSSTVD